MLALSASQKMKFRRYLINLLGMGMIANRRFEFEQSRYVTRAGMNGKSEDR